MKRKYKKKITTLIQQIEKIERRGIFIGDMSKALKVLTDVGYYRLGYYIFPFEVNYPELGKKRDRNVIKGTTFEHIVAFYEYNKEVRHILNKYLSTIEVVLKAYISNGISLRHKNDPFWYVDKTIVDEKFIDDFYNHVYLPQIKGKGPIQRHHKKYGGKVAPIWKTIEFTTMGFVENLYENLLLNADKCCISTEWDEPAISKFGNYLSVLREVRNACAHNSVIVDLTLSKPVMAGSQACPTIPMGEQNTLRSALRIIVYMLCYISATEATNMLIDLRDATKKLLLLAPQLRSFIEKKTGMSDSALTLNNNFFPKIV